ncbi:energy transducer TonB [Mucilaginibacter terrae]|uniref:Outer membrane biosynthesis protein TonB n=1 Tax=Mucilaginibacter terrae TaxID=1955052 RepID=A0ABU3GSM8_9SPHI|nr:energy transducer TonB [Mucilaginibacter terrae]MDT3402486.1 outer membrane biosynthesis protein TonB [Mucilaginibacter terrae]
MVDHRKEENNYPKAFLATSVILAMLIGLSYFIVFQRPPKEDDGTGGILVNYGTVDEGMGDDYMSTEEPSVAEQANNQRPDKATPVPPTEQVNATDDASKPVVTQNTEDAPEVSSSNKPSQAVATQQPVKETPKPTVNQNALYKGKTNNGTGEGDGTGSTPGNQGKTTGTTLTNNYNGTGSGNGGNLTNMPQRNFVSKPAVTDDGRHTGKVVVDLRVDKDGNVTYARGGARGTTITDQNLIDKCEEAVKRSRLNSLENAPDMQQGTVVFVFRVQ